MADVIAFVDEYGTNALNADAGSCFIIASVLVRNEDLPTMTTGVEAIRREHFQTGEMKSKSIGQNDRRRATILRRLVELPFTFYALVVDKDEVDRDSGLRFKGSFYKFVDGLLYRKLFDVHPSLHVYADQIGGTDYMESFRRHVANRHISLLFKRQTFDFSTWTDQPVLQVADMIAGTLARWHDPEKQSEAAEQFVELLQPKCIGISTWPVRYAMPLTGAERTHDNAIRNVALQQAAKCLDDLREAEEDPEWSQREILDALLFQFQWKSEHEFLQSEILMQLLEVRRHPTTIRALRSMIGALRDRGAIIVNQQQGGYKLPRALSDLDGFVQHTDRIVGPMIARVAKARETLRLATSGAFDPLAAPEYEFLRQIVDLRQGIALPSAALADSDEEG